MTPLTPRYPVDVVSDVHLSRQDPATVQAFLSFLAAEDSPAATLIILGDLFDGWMGDDATDELAETVAQSLRQRHERGTAIYFVPGNRDFLLAHAYCERAGMTRVDEPIILRNTNPPTALIHGDRLCTDDDAYQRFREKTQDPQWRAKILNLPIWLRRVLRAWARHRSQRYGAHQTKKRPEIMDVNQQSVDRYCEALGVTRLIHGHTHRLGTHRPKDGAALERWVLGDWHTAQGSYLRLTPDACQLFSVAHSPGFPLSQRAIEQPPGH